MSKRDRQGARTPADLERKYEFDFISRLESDSKKQSEQIDRQNRTMDEFISNSSTTLTSMERDISRAKKDISSLKVGVNSLSIRISNAENKDKTTSQSITGLAQRISSAETRLIALEADFNARLKTAEETLADLVERVTALEST